MVINALCNFSLDVELAVLPVENTSCFCLAYSFLLSCSLRIMKGYMAHLDSKKKKVLPDVLAVIRDEVFTGEALFQEQDYSISMFK